MLERMRALGERGLEMNREITRKDAKFEEGKS